MVYVMSLEAWTTLIEGSGLVIGHFIVERRSYCDQLLSQVIDCFDS
jgi:hypothetical protein